MAGRLHHLPTPLTCPNIHASYFQMSHSTRVAYSTEHGYPIYVAIYLAFRFNSTNYRYNYCRDKIKTSRLLGPQHAA